MHATRQKPRHDKPNDCGGLRAVSEPHEASSRVALTRFRHSTRLRIVLTIGPTAAYRWPRHDLGRTTMTTTVGPAADSQDSRNFALLTWIGTIFFGFVPALIVYLIKKDDAYVVDQAKEALNWAITACIGFAVAFVLTFVLIGILLVPIIAIANLVFCILGAIAASSGKPFRVPWALRLIK
jgi:uncharacterized protein